MKSISELWGNFKQSNICVTGELEPLKGGWGDERRIIFEEIMFKNFPNLMTTKNTQSIEGQQTQAQEALRNNTKALHNQIAQNQCRKY